MGDAPGQKGEPQAVPEAMNEAIALHDRVLREVFARPDDAVRACLEGQHRLLYATEAVTKDSGEWGQEAPIPG